MNEVSNLNERRTPRTESHITSSMNVEMALPAQVFGENNHRRFSERRTISVKAVDSRIACSHHGLWRQYTL